MTFYKRCQHLKSQAIQEICSSFKERQFVGSLCDSLCDKNNLKLSECPNMSGHNGKDYVFIADLFDEQNKLSDKIVLKARTLTTFELIGNNNWRHYFKDNKHFIIKAINDVMTARFGDQYIGQNTDNKNEFYFINKFISGRSATNQNQFNETTLLNVWLLIQDNEYVLSRFYPTIFPSIVGTCGHFYGVKYSDHILEMSYFLPNFWWTSSQTLRSRIEIGINLMDFLIRFQGIDPKLELCDIKYEHFGFISQQLLLIDSDMIYTKKAAIDSIQSLSHCQQNSDCDFIDCKGVCLQNKCSIDETDDDLKRLCRNILFMGKLYHIFDFGLFNGQTTSDQYFINSFKLIEKYCFQRTHLSNDIKQIKRVLFDIKNKLN